MRADADADADAIARRVATQRAMANEHAHVLACASLALCAPNAWEDAANVTNASVEEARARRERREVSRAWRAARDEEAARRRAEEDAREEDFRAARRQDLVGERRAREARVRRREETRREAARVEKEKADGRLERQTSKAANAAMIEMFQVRARGQGFVDFQRGGDSNRIVGTSARLVRLTNARTRSLEFSQARDAWDVARRREAATHRARECSARELRLAAATSRRKPFIPRPSEGVRASTECAERRALAALVDRNRDPPGVFDADRRPGWVLNMTCRRKTPEWRRLGDTNSRIREY